MRSHEEIKNNKALGLTTCLINAYQGYITLASGKKGTVMAGRNEDGWEHVSICLYREKKPTWEDMCEVKDIFWDDEEQVVQIHPRKSQYVNITEAFHLWRPANGDWEIMNDSERVKE
jgi:hypothetical protein